MLRAALTHLLAAYLGAGLFLGLLTQRAIPAVNPVGIVIITLTWPNHIRCARIASGCKPIPEWLSPYVFTFSGADNAK